MICILSSITHEMEGSTVYETCLEELKRLPLYSSRYPKAPFHNDGEYLHKLVKKLYENSQVVDKGDRYDRNPSPGEIYVIHEAIPYKGRNIYVNNTNRDLIIDLFVCDSHGNRIDSAIYVGGQYVTNTENKGTFTKENPFPVFNLVFHDVMVCCKDTINDHKIEDDVTVHCTWVLLPREVNRILVTLLAADFYYAMSILGHDELLHFRSGMCQFGSHPLAYSRYKGGHRCPGVIKNFYCKGHSFEVEISPQDALKQMSNWGTISTEDGDVLIEWEDDRRTTGNVLYAGSLENYTERFHMCTTFCLCKNNKVVVENPQELSEYLGTVALSRNHKGLLLADGSILRVKSDGSKGKVWKSCRDDNDDKDEVLLTWNLDNPLARFIRRWNYEDTSMLCISKEGSYEAFDILNTRQDIYRSEMFYLTNPMQLHITFPSSHRDDVVEFLRENDFWFKEHA